MWFLLFLLHQSWHLIFAQKRLALDKYQSKMGLLFWFRLDWRQRLLFIMLHLSLTRWLVNLSVTFAAKPLPCLVAIISTAIFAQKIWFINLNLFLAAWDFGRHLESPFRLSVFHCLFSSTNIKSIMKKKKNKVNYVFVYFTEDFLFLRH